MDSHSCMQCAHFSNNPEFLERTFPGWQTMGSAHGSVRKDDGICAVHDIYLSAHNSCDKFTPIDRAAEAR
jgi:hypothetical protein